MLKIKKNLERKNQRASRTAFSLPSFLQNTMLNLQQSITYKNDTLHTTVPMYCRMSKKLININSGILERQKKKFTFKTICISSLLLDEADDACSSRNKLSKIQNKFLFTFFCRLGLRAQITS